MGTESGRFFYIDLDADHQITYQLLFRDPIDCTTINPTPLSWKQFVFSPAWGSTVVVLPSESDRIYQLTLPTENMVNQQIHAIFLPQYLSPTTNYLPHLAPACVGPHFTSHSARQISLKVHQPTIRVCHFCRRRTTTLSSSAAPSHAYHVFFFSARTLSRLLY